MLTFPFSQYVINLFVYRLRPVALECLKESGKVSVGKAKIVQVLRPTTMKELTKKEKKDAMKEKEKTGRVKKYKKK